MSDERPIKPYVHDPTDPNLNDIDPFFELNLLSLAE